MVKKLRIKESAHNNDVDYGELIEKNRDKIADMLVDKAHDMFDTYEQDLYIYTLMESYHGLIMLAVILGKMFPIM